MPKKDPYEFKNESEIIEMLLKQKPSLDRWFTRSIHDLSIVVRDSISGNTFRAFAHMPHKPSVVFRNWAKTEFSNPNELISVLKNKSQEKYDEWTNDLVKKLSSHWHYMMDNPMPYGASRKLTNLVVKHLILWQGFTEDDRQTLKKLAHVPFDQYVLVSLRRCLNWVSIPTNPTMRFVDSYDLYYNLQKYIRKVTAEAKLSPIYFDILCWNLAHPQSMNGR